MVGGSVNTDNGAMETQEIFQFYMLFYDGVGVVSFIGILEHRESNQARTDHNWGGKIQ